MLKLPKKYKKYLHSFLLTHEVSTLEMQNVPFKSRRRQVQWHIRRIQEDHHLKIFNKLPLLYQRFLGMHRTNLRENQTRSSLTNPNTLRTLFLPSLYHSNTIPTAKVGDVNNLWSFRTNPKRTVEFMVSPCDTKLIDFLSIFFPAKKNF